MPTVSAIFDDGLGEDIRQILDAIPAAIFVKDAKGRYVIVNRMCEQVWGISRDELLMSDGSSLFNRDELDFFLAMDEEVFVRGTEQNYKTTYWHKTRNAHRAGHTFKRPIYDDHGNPRFVVCVSFDASDQENTESNTIESDHKLRGLLGQMASALAHEVNQPLTAMSNWIEAARHHLIKADRNPPPKVLEFLDNAVKQANFAARIIANLRRFVTSGELSTQPVSINRTIEDIFRLATMGAHKARVHTALNLAPDLPMVLIDRTQIQQVIINLSRNAIEAMAESPIRQLTISTSLVDHQVEVRISDTGPGLDSYVAERLFKPFVTTKSNGMGMGLSICQTILESHGGRLWAEPGVDQGSVFSFSLPCVATDSDIGTGL